MTFETGPDNGFPPSHRPSIRVSKAATILEVNVSTIYRLVQSGTLEGHRIGKCGIRVFADSLRCYQEQGKIHTSNAQNSKSIFHESKIITSNNPAYRDAIAYLQSIGCLK